MRVLVQKCLQGSVTCGDITRSIAKGYVLFVGFTDGDDEQTIQYLARKVAHLRIFEDDHGVMNHSILEINGSVLSISQFTLYADSTSGNRPSYVKALKSDQASVLYDLWNQELAKYVPVQTGFFGKNMTVHIDNLGPTTILLEK